MCGSTEAPTFPGARIQRGLGSGYAWVQGVLFQLDAEVSLLKHDSTALS